MAEELELNELENEELIDAAEEQSDDFGGYNDLTTLEPREQVRLRPGMYIGKLGDGSQSDDGIYVLFKEVMDNSIDEFNTGHAKALINIDVTETSITVRDFGRGIPLEAVERAVSVMNTSGKYDTANYKRSVGLNGVGMKATNFLSNDFYVHTVRAGQSVTMHYQKGKLVEDSGIVAADPNEENGTEIKFFPDPTIFKNYAFHLDIIETMVKNYSFLNTKLTIALNGKNYHSRNGLVDLLKENMTDTPLYPIIHFVDEDIEIAITHGETQHGEEFYSFVNSQHTTQGGTHQSAFREIVSRTIKEFYKKNFEYSDIRNGMIAAISIKVEEPVFESQTKIKLGSTDLKKGGPTVYTAINTFLSKQLDDYLHKETEIAEQMLGKIQQSERERKAMAGAKKLVRERNKKVALHNNKLRDCRVHFNDAKAPKGNDRREESSIFITEGLSASGSITKIRDVETQAVFSLRGKPLNTYALDPKKVVANEEFGLLQAALNIEDGIDGLRYNKVIVATDADVDGMHIRLLLLTYFLQFCPELVKTGHLFILQTPLFRVRNKKEAKRKSNSKQAKQVKPETYYCYSDSERVTAIEKLGDKAEITRFKGLGEIDPEEFADFIGPEMRLDRVHLRKEDNANKLLEFYMGKNTMDRQEFIIDNLVIEDDEDITQY